MVIKLFVRVIGNKVTKSDGYSLKWDCPFGGFFFLSVVIGVI